MATNTTFPEKAEHMPLPQLLPWETLGARHKIAPFLLAGVSRAEGWRAGKAVEEGDFLKAVARFKDAAIDGKLRREGGRSR